MIEIGSKLRELREAKKMSQKALAEVLHVTPQAISKWELNKSYPDLATLLKISQFFGVSTDELLGNAKATFFAALVSKLKGPLVMEKALYETLPKATSVQVMAGILKVHFDNGVEKYVKSHGLVRASDPQNQKKVKIPKLMGTQISIEADGTVVLNGADRYTPEELWQDGALTIDVKWGFVPFA